MREGRMGPPSSEVQSKETSSNPHRRQTLDPAPAAQHVCRIPRPDPPAPAGQYVCRIPRPDPSAPAGQYVCRTRYQIHISTRGASSYQNIEKMWSLQLDTILVSELYCIWAEAR